MKIEKVPDTEDIPQVSKVGNLNRQLEILAKRAAKLNAYSGISDYNMHKVSLDYSMALPIIGEYEGLSQGLLLLIKEKEETIKLLTEIIRAHLGAADVEL